MSMKTNVINTKTQRNAENVFVNGMWQLDRTCLDNVFTLNDLLFRRKSRMPPTLILSLSFANIGVPS